MPIEDVDKKELEERKCRTNYDLVRLRLERLQKNMDKLAPIPAKRVERGPRGAPEFVRNVMGSSAAAGSADFHIYRNNRRKEMNRLDWIEKCAKKDAADTAFSERRAAFEAEESSKTAKRRAKRLKRKEKLKAKRASKKAKKDDGDTTESSSGSSDSSSEDENSSSDDETAPAADAADAAGSSKKEDKPEDDTSKKTVDEETPSSSTT